MKAIRGVKADRRGNGAWLAVISDPFLKKQRRFHFSSQTEATAKKVQVTEKIRAIQKGLLTVPANVTDVLLWLVKDGKEGFADTADQPTTIEGLIAGYRERQEGRVGKKGPTGISAVHFQSEKFHLGVFEGFCKRKKRMSLETAITAENLEEFKTYAGERWPSPYSLANATYTVKALIMWAWQTRKIEEVPRNLKSFRQVSLPDPDAKVFTAEEVETLYRHGSPRMKLYILLALNGGYTQQDITDLKHESIDWEAGTIEEVRGKVKKTTKVPRRIKLWPSTLERLKLEASDPSISDHVLLTPDGNPLVRHTLVGEKVQVVDVIQRSFLRFKKRLQIGGRSFKHFRKTGSDLIKNKYIPAKRGTKTNAELFDMYLAHKPPRVVASYDPKDWAELHLATDWLGESLGLAQADVAQVAMS